VADSDSTADVQDKAALPSDAPPAHSKVASHNEFAYTSATTSDAGTDGNPSAGPNRPTTTFAYGKSSYHSFEDKKKAEVPWWETDIRTHVATMTSESGQLDDVLEQSRKLKDALEQSRQLENVLPRNNSDADMQQKLWDLEDGHDKRMEQAALSLRDTFRTARGQGCTEAIVETILGEGQTDDRTQKWVRDVWEPEGRGSRSGNKGDTM